MLEPVLHGAELSALCGDGVDRRVDLGDVRACRGHLERRGGDALAERDRRDRDDLAVLGADLERDRVRRAQQQDAVELRARTDPLHLGSQHVDLGLDRRLVGRRQRAVLVLHGEIANALQHGVDLLQRTLGRLHERDGVLRVSLGLVEPPDLTLQLLADGESGCVVCCSVDAVAARQALHGLRELVARSGELAVCVERLDVRIDSQRH